MSFSAVREGYGAASNAYLHLICPLLLPSTEGP